MFYEETDRATSLPPYKSIDNPDCLLDIADIVLVDPVGTGYGVLLDENSADKFYGIEEDAEALLVFIEKWLHRYGRWTSPKYLIGELRLHPCRHRGRHRGHPQPRALLRAGL